MKFSFSPRDTGGFEADFPPAAWTRRQSPYPRDRGVQDIFREIAGRVPDRPAIRTEKSEITYADLDRRTNQLANFLIDQGVKSGDRIGLLLDRSSELIIAQLAILKAGAVYVPMDPGEPRERVAFFAGDAALVLMICADGARITEGWPGPRILRLDEAFEAIAQSSAARLGQTAKGGDPAYVMYTSGSTGVPKGVEIPHRAIVRLVLAQDYFPAGPDQCTLLLGSPGFDATTYEIWSALLHGGCCAVFPDRWIDPQRLEHVIRTLGVTRLWVSTGLFNQIIDHHPRLFETTRHVMTGGQALSVAHMHRAMHAMPHVQFGNGYGPTECTTFACSWIIDPDPATWGCESVPLGFPLNNTECHILKDDLQPAPVGVVGELCLGGDGLALGYLNRPELTAERFVEHPSSDVPGARLYRTGDLCFWMPNGMIAYVGRNDDQVKLRGYRIELGEVEASLRHCAGVEDVAVVVHEFPSGTRGLVGCVVVKADHPWEESAALADLALRLPEAMLPNRLIQAPQLPLTQNGKVDARKIAATVAAKMLAEKSAPATPITAPATAKTVSQLLPIWRRVLKDASVDAQSDFFRLGGDSLLAVDLSSEIEREMGRRIPVGSVYRFSTPDQLARWLDDPVSSHDPLALEPATGLFGDGPGAPVFFVPGVAGYGLIPKSMSEGLAGRHPYFDRLTFPAINLETDPSLTVEGIARSLAIEVRRVCPRGPYIFVGYSFGGLVAFELARQFIEAGDHVENLILWDSYPVATIERASALVACARVIHLALSPARWGALRRKLPGLRRRLSAFAQRIAGVVTNNQARKETPYNIEAVYPPAETYRPRPYAGRLTLLACSEEEDSWIFQRYVDNRQAWAQLVPADRLQVIDMEGKHLDILDTHHRDSFIKKTLEIIRLSVSVIHGAS